MEKKRDFLVNVAYWAVIAGAVYLGFEYLLPVSVPFILGILIAYFVVRISRRFRCTHPLFRIALIVVIYGLIGLGIELFVIYAIVTVIRNYVEPKIVAPSWGSIPLSPWFPCSSACGSSDSSVCSACL